MTKDAATGAVINKNTVGSNFSEIRGRIIAAIGSHASSAP
jgi:hypothetical protein